MASLQKTQENAMALIDTAKAMTDKVLGILGLVLSPPSITFATNPIGFLLQMLSHMGVTYEDLQKWLTDFLVYVVPALEVSVKTILLTNLKNMVSCSIDPRIPAKFRKQHKDQDDPTTPNEYGIDIDIESIDFLDKLSLSPLSEEGQELYFGLEGVEDSYKFARADDFDAFLWFVIHKGKFPMPTQVESNEALQNKFNAVSVVPSSGCMISTTELAFDPATNGASSILLGNTFTCIPSGETVARRISMCIDTLYDESDNIIHNTIVPVSDDWNSVNWYARKMDMLASMTGIGWEAASKGRNFDDEKAICNLQYIDQASSTSPIIGTVNNKLRFAILPKPVVHIPNIVEGDAPWRFVKLLFNANGDYDPNGKYTLADNSYVESGDSNSRFESYLGGAVKVHYKTQFDSNGNTFQVEVDSNQKGKLMANLVECYPGLTVYEFNYDYIMSIKLFDAKVLATTLLDSLINMQMGVNISLQRKHQAATDTVKEIIKNIINSDDSTVSDCYFTFDNSKYDELLRKAEQKRADMQPFGDVTRKMGSFDSIKEILAEYDANADLNVQVDVLSRTITEAAVTISQGSDAKDMYNVQFNFVLDLIENLVFAIVESILSPKVLMLLEVNQQLMGGTWKGFSLEDLLRAMSSIITSIIKEVRDLIVQELLKFLLKQLEPIIQLLGTILIREQLEAYAEIIQDIIRNCPFIWWSLKNRYADTTLDTVDYADIDASETIEDAPLSNNC